MDAAAIPNEALRLYLSEITDAEQATTELEEEHEPLDEVEQATDFLQKAGLSNLSKLYHEGKEIPDCVLIDSIEHSHLTEKQAQTVKSRVKTLNKSHRNRQPRRKQRQDIRDVSWNLETSSTGSRSRSATPDSLDSIEVLNEDLTSDEDQQFQSLSSYQPENGPVMFKGKLKWTSSEPLPSKVFNRQDRGNIAHLGSDNVILKGYHPLKEPSSITRVQVEHSGNDEITEVHFKSMNHKSAEILSTNFPSIISTTHTSSFNVPNDGAISFEGCVKQNQEPFIPMNITEDVHAVSIDRLTDSEYQYLKPLLWVEVIAIFDHYNIFVLKRKANNKNKRGNVFGVNLSTLVMRDMPVPTDNSMVPQVYQSVLSHLNNRCIEEDGILRLAGQKQKLEILCNEIELKFYSNRDEVENMLQEASVHDLTGVIKKLLRELHDPVFTMELFDMFFKCSLIPTLDDKVRALNILVLMLPIEHRNTFKLLLEFFTNIVKHEHQNRMNLHNVAMITAPSFFPPRLILTKGSRDDKVPMSKQQLAKEINDAAVCCNIMELLLRTGKTLWMIPAELALQAQEAQKRAQSRKELVKDKKAQTKKKLQRSSTQYEPGAMLNSRIKRDYYI